jgi:L-threonylcarbamoyladenylate synthase
MKSELAIILKTNGIAVFPTDTLYGVVGSALSKKTVERIYRLKGRDENKPFIILVSSYKDLEIFGVTLSLEQKKFLTSVWPGPVSVILPCPFKKFEYLHRGSKTLAFRMPKNKALQTLLRKTGPLVAPSANPQGEAPAETIVEAKAYFSNQVDAYVAGGRKKGKPSTVVSLCDSKKIVLVRQGTVQVELQ